MFSVDGDGLITLGSTYKDDLSPAHKETATTSYAHDRNRSFNVGAEQYQQICMEESGDHQAEIKRKAVTAAP